MHAVKAFIRVSLGCSIVVRMLSKIYQGDLGEGGRDRSWEDQRRQPVTAAAVVNGAG